MASDNNCELLRAFVVPAGGAQGERAVSNTVTSTIFAEVEAGRTIFFTRAGYTIVGVVTDLNTGTVVGTGTVNGNLGTAPWDAQAKQISVVNLATGLTADHVHRATLALQVGGGANPIADFAEILFLITS
jgi:hypothetical protein